MERYKVFKLKVKPTDALGSVFVVNGKYFDCEDGCLHILAKSLIDVINEIEEEHIIQIELECSGYLIRKEGENA